MTETKQKCGAFKINRVVGDWLCLKELGHPGKHTDSETGSTWGNPVVPYGMRKKIEAPHSTPGKLGSSLTVHCIKCCKSPIGSSLHGRDCGGEYRAAPGKTTQCPKCGTSYTPGVAVSKT